MECVPTINVEAENVATPLLFKDEVPSGVVPSENVTLPVGVPVVSAVTAAVTVIACPG